MIAVSVVAILAIAAVAIAVPIAVTATIDRDRVRAAVADHAAVMAAGNLKHARFIAPHDRKLYAAAGVVVPGPEEPAR